MKGSNLRRIKKLEQEVAMLRSHIWWLVGGGEFAAWAQNKPMPLAARKEFDEARALFPDDSWEEAEAK
jgi:hypothetical protein